MLLGTKEKPRKSKGTPTTMLSWRVIKRSRRRRVHKAQISYLLNDYVALGVGEFFSPSTVFVERFEPQWINKLPDRPIGVYHGVLPNISVGAQVRGGFPIGPTRADYAFYVSNGPVLNTFDASSAGTLDFNSYTDNNDNKAVGGRVGSL